MSIELPKYSIQTTQDEPKKFIKILLPLFVIIGFITGYFLSNLYANKTLKTLEQRNDVLEELNNKNQDIISQQKNDLSILKTEQKVRQQGILLLQQDYKKSIDAQDALKAEIDFYQRLLSPNAENKGLRVFETHLKKNNDNSFNLKVILVQKLERARNIAGSYKILVKGIEDGEEKTIQLSESKDSKFNFKYYYTVSLNFSLPEGFKPEQLVVELLPKLKKAKTITHAINWQSLTQQDKDHV